MIRLPLDPDLLTTEQYNTLTALGHALDRGYATYHAGLARFPKAILAAQEKLEPPSVASDTGPVSGGGVSDRTFAAVMHRQPGRADIDRLITLGKALNAANAGFHNFVMHLIGMSELAAAEHLEVKKAATCSAGKGAVGHSFVHGWGLDECDRIAPPGRPLCDECHAAQQAWIKDRASFPGRAAWDAMSVLRRAS